jgi:hypothetical protein
VTINGGNDTVAVDKCASNSAAFCTTAQAVVNGELSPATFSTLAAGQAFILNAGLSSLDSCTGGSIQYQFSECESLTTCLSPTILKDFSSSSTQQVSPAVTTRYDVSVRCSSVGSCISTGALNGTSCDVGNPDLCEADGGGGGMCMPGGCDDTALVTVIPVNPSQCGLINIDVACGTGGCTAGGEVDISFTKPNPAGVGLDLDRGTSAQLATPITTLGNLIAGPVHSGTAPGVGITLTDALAFGGSLDYYLVSCDYAGPKSAGNQRIGGAPVARFQNP